LAKNRRNKRSALLMPKAIAPKGQREAIAQSAAPKAIAIIEKPSYKPA
jgi:hypothetical protein